MSRSFWRTGDISKDPSFLTSHPPMTDFGFKNLLVSGCSFTHSLDYCPTWATFLKQLGSFENLIDCSCPGAGNFHIHHSTIWKIENDPELTPENTFVAVMWSGYDRDDMIVDPISIDPATGCDYKYSDHASLALSGGVSGTGNTIVSLENIKKIKNLTSRSIDNYILISGLYHYLLAKKFKFVFLEFSTPLSKYDFNFEPTTYLGNLGDSFEKYVRKVKPNLGDYADVKSLPTNHPQAEHHLAWCRDVLIPYLTKQF
jgi:hypothetical protein